MSRSVAIIILYNQDKKILLQHRAEDAKRLPGYWAFFGGGIEAGETPERSVKREALEELNYELKNPKLVMTQKFFINNEDSAKYIFMEKFDENKKIVLGEGQGFGWFGLHELNGLKIVEHDKDVLEYIKGKF